MTPAVRSFVRSSVRLSGHFPWSDFDQFFFCSNPFVTHMNARWQQILPRGQEACSRCIMVYMVSSRISPLLLND